jgi:putative lipoprotein
MVALAEKTEMGKTLRSLVALGGLLVSMQTGVAGQNAPAADAAGTVTGVATYRERIAMPKNAVFEATLADVSKMDAPAETIGTAVMENPGNPPYHFSISYDPRRIVDNHSYAVRATIKIGGELAFTSDTSYPVITRGNGKEVNILLKSAGGRTASTGTDRSRGSVPLENTTWRVTRVNGKDVVAGENQRAPYIVLQASEHRVSGSGGCNRITGTYSVEKQTIHFGPMASTMMACPSGMDTEKDFMEALDAARRWKIQGNELELYGEDGNLLVRFVVDESK